MNHYSQKWMLGIKIVLQSVAVLLPLVFLIPINGYLHQKYDWIGMLIGFIVSVGLMGWYGYGFKDVIFPKDQAHTHKNSLIN